MKNKKTVKIKKRLPKYDMGGDTPKKLFDINNFGQLGNIAGAATGSINSELDWKNTKEYSVANDPLQKTIESGLGSNPITSTFMNIGKAGEALGDSIAPGLGEGLFSPHKSVMRAFKEGKPEYMIPIVGSMIAAGDSKKQLNQETLDKSKLLNPYGDSVLKLGGALIKYNAPSHENGGQMITSTGAETNNPNKAIAEIEKKETMHNGYVFSDTLKAPNGKTFAAVSKTIENRFKSKNDPISEKTRKLQLDLLKSQNETLKNQVENMTPTMELGGDPIKGKLRKVASSMGESNLDTNMDDSYSQGDDFNFRLDYTKSQLEKDGISVEGARNLNRMNFGAYNPSFWEQELHKLDKEGEQNKKYYPNIKLKCGGGVKKMDNGGDPTKLFGEEIIPGAGGNYFGTFDGLNLLGLPEYVKPGDKKTYSTTQINPVANPTTGLVDNIALQNKNMLRNLGESESNSYRLLNNYSGGVDINDVKAVDELNKSGVETVVKTDKNGNQVVVPKTGIESKGMDYLTPARIGKGIEMAGKAGILSAGYDKVKPELNPESAKVKELMKNRINNQALLNQINLQRNAALVSNQDARSLNVKRALDARTYNSAAKAAMTAKLQEQMQNNAYKQQEAGVLSQLGSEEARAKVYAEDATARNKGQWLTNLGTVLGDVGRAGEFETKVKVNDMQVAESLAMLGMKYQDYGVDANTYKRLKEGKYTIADVEKLQEGLIKYKGNGK